MNPEQKQVVDAVKEMIDNALPEAVKSVVAEENKEIKKDVEDVKNSIAEFNKTMKTFNYAND
jgi:RNA-splicing ligase RtcB